MENIEAYQSYYMAEVNQVDSRHFDKHLAHIALCNPAVFDFTPAEDTLCSLYLHPTHGFQWDRELVGEEDLGFGGT